MSDSETAKATSVPEREAEQLSLDELAAQLEKSAIAGRRRPDIRVPPPRSYIEWAGVWQSWVVLGLITIFLAGLLVYLVLATPGLGEFGSPVTADSLAQWQKASDVVHQRVTGLVDLVVFKILLPLLTLLLGYVFGSRAGQGPPSGSEG